MGSWTFACDHLNRLMSGIPSTGAYSGQGESLCMDYDSFGNRTQADLQTTACKPNPTPSVSNSAYDPNNANYNASNQVSFTTVNSASSGFAYDAAGDVTFDGVNYYAYDAEGRVCATQTAPYSGGIVAYGYLYDAEGRRVAKGSINSVPLGQFPSCNLATNGFKLTESYVLGQGGEQLTTLAWTGGATGTSAWQRTNVYAGGKLIATYDAGTAGQSADAGNAGGLHFQLTDPLGSRRVQANSAGEAELDCQSLPFGDQLNCFPDPNAPADDQDEDATGILTGIHFTGKERDTESGLDYFGARYYASGMGRFLSPDWSAKISPVPYAVLGNPQSLNLYSYVGNNPLSRTDPTGHYELNDSGCNGDAKCQKRYDKAANQFEKQRQKDLNSKKEAVRNAAANYGAKGEANGVHVGFADLSSQHIDGSVNPSGSTAGNPNIQVTLDFGRAGSAETQTHEGTHIGDDMNFLNSFSPATGGYDQSLNITHFQTEFNAFKAGAYVDFEHGFGPNDTQKITDYINANYPAQLLNMPIFNPVNFPAGVPDDEQ